MREEIKMKKKVCVNVFINAGVYHEGGYDCSAWTLLEVGHSSQGFKVKSLWIQSWFKANFSVLCLCRTLGIKKMFNSQIFLEKSFAMILSTWNFCRTLSSVSLRHLHSRFSENLRFMGVHSSTTKVWWRSGKVFCFPRELHLNMPFLKAMHYYLYQKYCRMG